MTHSRFLARTSFLIVTLGFPAACDRNGTGNTFDREGARAGDDEPIPVGKEQSANVRAVNDGGPAGMGASANPMDAATSGGTGSGGRDGGKD